MRGDRVVGSRKGKSLNRGSKRIKEDQKVSGSAEGTETRRFRGSKKKAGLEEEMGSRSLGDVR